VTALEARLAGLRARLASRYVLRDISVPLAGQSRALLVTAPADPDAPLDAMAAVQARRADGPIASPMTPLHGPAAAAGAARATIAEGAHLPYWALLWPSGLALAEALLAAPETVRGRKTLELGCGLGSTAAVALTLGARLTVSDLFPDALLFAAHNCQRHAGITPRRKLLNWRTASGRAALLAAAPYDTLLAADILYEQDDIALLLTLVPALLATDGIFWLAEPGRKASRAFIAAATTDGNWRAWTHDETCYERHWPPDGDVVRVSAHRFIRRS
jgi:predicted nicotinamide N-methyase